MRFAFALRTFVLAATLASGAALARDSGNTAGDLLVDGRVETLKYEPLDDLSLDARITARLTITRVVRGRPPSQVLTISYIAHADFVEGRDVRFHLRRSKDGMWLSCRKGGGRGYVCP